MKQNIIVKKTVLLISFLFIAISVAFAESDAVITFKKYLKEIKSANSVQEIAEIEKKYRLDGDMEGTLVALADIEELRKSQVDPGQLQILRAKETGDTANIEYQLINNPQAYGEAVLVKQGGAWKIKEYGLMDFSSFYKQ
jgi:hypothetical protein